MPQASGPPEMVVRDVVLCLNSFASDSEHEMFDLCNGPKKLIASKGLFNTRGQNW